MTSQFFIIFCQDLGGLVGLKEKLLVDLLCSDSSPLSWIP